MERGHSARMHGTAVRRIQGHFHHDQYFYYLRFVLHTYTSGYTGNDSFKVRVSDGLYSELPPVFTLPSMACSPPSPVPPLSARGATVTLSDATTGGGWSTADAFAASVDPSSGMVTGIAPGTAVTITYSAAIGCGSSFVIRTVTEVMPLPAAITGATAAVCPATSVPLTETTTGGAWSSANTSVTQPSIRPVQPSAYCRAH